MKLVTDKKINVDGKDVLVKILNIEDNEGWTTQQAANYLGTSEANIKQIVKRNGILFVTLSLQQRNTLKENSIIPIKANRIQKFLPKESIQALVKIINTPNAWAMYNQLWSVTEAVHSGNIKQAQEWVGIDEKTALGHLEMAIDGWKKAAAERDRLKVVVASAAIGDAQINELNKVMAEWRRVHNLKGGAKGYQIKQIKIFFRIPKNTPYTSMNTTKFEKAKEYVSTLPCPDWLKEKWGKAREISLVAHDMGY